MQVLSKQLPLFIKRVIKHVSYKTNYWLNISFPQYFITLLLPKKVLYGPFKGMHYIPQSTGSVILPKLIGSYEIELLPVLESIKSNHYDLFVDIGAAEGYYAVGVYKYIFKETIPCVAFEATTKGQKQINQLATLNHAKAINIKGFCDENELNNTISGKKAFIIIDIEGGEFDLLNLEKVPHLKNSDILVELHPEAFINIKEVIYTRFQQTHTIDEYRIWLNKPFPDSINLPSYLEPYKQYMLNEFRGDQSWLYLKAKLDN